MKDCARSYDEQSDCVEEDADHAIGNEKDAHEQMREVVDLAYDIVVDVNGLQLSLEVLERGVYRVNEA